MYDRANQTAQIDVIQFIKSNGKHFDHIHGDLDPSLSCSNKVKLRVDKYRLEIDHNRGDQSRSVRHNYLLLSVYVVIYYRDKGGVSPMDLIQHLCL